MVPVLLTLGTHAFANSIRLTQGTFRGLGYKIQLFDYTLLAAACCTFLLFALFLQWSVVPQLQVAAAKIIMIS